MTLPGRLLAVAAALLATALPARSAVEVDVSVNRRQIYLGESVLLSVKVSGSNRSDQPDLSGLPDCRVRFLGSQDRSSYSITFINGKMSRTGFSGREFTYEVTPSKTGRIPMGPVALEHEGQRIVRTGPEIEVMGIEDQDVVLIRVEASKNSVLVDEPFSVTLSIAMKRLKGRFADADPLLPPSPPKLTVPYLSGEPMPGLEGPDVSRLLQGLLAQNPNQPGFGINGLTVRSDPIDSFFRFGDFTNDREAKFALQRRAIERNGEPYYEYRLTVAYTPRDEGNHTFGPVVFKGDAVTEAGPTGQALTRRIFAVGPACAVRVVPPPEESRPPTFVGAIGSNLVVEARLDAHTCKVGDPLSLTLSLSGHVNTRNLRPPVLSDQPALARDFRVYDENVQAASRDGRREYTYTLRPLRAGTYEVPPIEVTYYDVRQRAYCPVRTQPLPLRVQKSAEVDLGDIIEASTNRVTIGISVSGGDAPAMAPLDMDPSGGDREPLGIPPPLAAAAAAGPVAFALLVAGRAATRAARRLANDRRRRGALRRALSSVDRIKAAEETDAAVPARLAATLRGYLAQRLDLRGAAAMGPGEVRALLVREKVDPATAEAFAGLFERSFNASFTQSGLSAERVRLDCDESRRVLAAAEAALKRRSLPAEKDGSAE